MHALMQMILVYMCKECEHESFQPIQKTSIWDLAASVRCAVIGTCIEIDTLKQAKKRFNHLINEYQLESDYELHSYFVSICANKNPISQYLNKVLNKKYQHFLNQARSLKDDHRIETVWDSINKNDIRSLSGYFWAFMISKYISEEAKHRIYGDIHMISHIAGQNHRKSIQQLHDENQVLSGQLKKKEKQLDLKQSSLDKLKKELDSIKIRISQLRYSEQHTNNHDVGSYQQIIAKQDQRIIHLQQKLEQYKNQELKILPINVPPPKHEPLEDNCLRNCSSCQKSDLCGKKILYVGGFSRHRSKFQKMTEAINGQFFYHDGGKQESEHQLDELVKKADAIFCPIDCISHSAIGRIKSLVKSQCKDCIYLKSASLSSFKNEVTRYAS